MLYVSPKTQHVLLLTSVKSSNLEATGRAGGGGESFTRPDAMTLLSLVSRSGSWENMGVQILANHVIGEPVPETILYACLPHISKQNNLWSDQETRSTRVNQAIIVSLAHLNVDKTRQRCTLCGGSGSATAEELAARNGNYVCCKFCDGEGATTGQKKIQLAHIMRMAEAFGPAMTRYQTKVHFLPLMKEVMNVLLYAAATADEQIRVLLKRETRVNLE